MFYFLQNIQLQVAVALVCLDYSEPWSERGVIGSSSSFKSSNHEWARLSHAALSLAPAAASAFRRHSSALARYWSAITVITRRSVQAATSFFVKTVCR